MLYRVIPCRGRSNLYGLRRSQSSNFRVADNSKLFIGASRRTGKNQLDRCCTFPQQAIKAPRPSTRAREK